MERKQDSILRFPVLYLFVTGEQNNGWPPLSVESEQLHSCAICRRCRIYLCTLTRKNIIRISFVSMISDLSRIELFRIDSDVLCSSISVDFYEY